MKSKREQSLGDGPLLARRASFLLPLSLLGCKDSKRPDAAAAAFLDRYYIEREPGKALELATGGAAERLRSEQALRQQAGAGGGVQPRVFYKLEKQAARGEDVELTYELTIDSAGAKMKKRVLVLVRDVDGKPKVAFFAESDLPAG